MKKLSFLLILFLFLCSQGISQNKYFNKIKVVDGKPVSFFSSYEQLVNETDSIAFVSLLQNDIIDLWSKGFILANIDTVFVSDSSFLAKVYIGEDFRFGSIQITDEHLAIVHAAGLKNVRFNDKVVSIDLIDQYAETLLSYLEDNGFPFANVKLDSTSIVEGKINSNLILTKNRFVPFDSLALFGKVDIRDGYMSRYLNIRAKDPYNRSRINNIEKRINDLTFIELDSTPIIKFSNNVAQVQLYLKSKKASRFDFLIGVLPSTEQGQRTFSIIGEFTGEMYNKLGHGEYIFANVQSRPETRVLDIRFNYPYLFDLPLGIDLKGGIFFNEKFRETKWDVGILYQFDGSSSLKASWSNKTSRLIDIDTSSIIASEKLPNQLDISYNGGGLEYFYRDLDYRFNPSKGWEITLNGTLGLKKIIRNNRIEALSRTDLDFNLAYDTLKLNTLQTELNLSTSLYIPAFNIGTFKLGLEGGLQYNEEKIFENELYRIGGNSLLRGFDELSVLTSAYLVSTAEFRLLLDRNSYLSFPFIDYGLTRVVVDDNEQWDTAVSVGMGINFSTPAGIFNVSFAAGKRLDNPIDFGNTKIHFGYVSLF